MNDEQDHQRYTAALGLLNQERQLFWQTFTAFLVAHTVFMGFLLQAVSRTGLRNWAPEVFVASGIGLVLTGLWYVAHRRTAAYNRLRMAQAREAEPRSWKFLRDGQSFAHGNSLTIDNDACRLPRPRWLSRRLTTTCVVTALISLFAVIYAFVALLTAPWWPQGASILL
jgi:hypothetical protein